MTTRLIINADDYGRTAGISKGIRQAHLQGVVTSTTCMMNLPIVGADLELALQGCPGLGLGVHLNLTSGIPLLPPVKVASIVSVEGRFDGLDSFLVRLPGLNLEQVEGEWRAQIDKFVEITGKRPTHLDSHHHSSFFRRDLFALMLRLASEYSCAIRFPMHEGKLVDGLPDQLLEEAGIFLPDLLRQTSIRCPDDFITTFYDEGIHLEEMYLILEGLNEGTFEIMTHPGFVDDTLDSSYNRQREKEFQLLTDPKLRERIETMGIQLIHFGEV